MRAPDVDSEGLLTMSRMDCTLSGTVTVQPRGVGRAGRSAVLLAATWAQPPAAAAGRGRARLGNTNPGTEGIPAGTQRGS
eukprot:106939-Hanusia_phi.AAC.1